MWGKGGRKLEVAADFSEITTLPLFELFDLAQYVKLFVVFAVVDLSVWQEVGVADVDKSEVLQNQATAEKGDDQEGGVRRSFSNPNLHVRNTGWFGHRQCGPIGPK